MAAHLLCAGHKLTVYNRRPEKAQAWVADHPAARTAENLKAAVSQAEIVVSCVGNDADLESLTLGEHGGLSALPPGAVWIDHTTTSALLARRVHAAAAALDIGFIDAPVSGGEIGAQQGTLTIMCGGTPEVVVPLLPWLKVYAKATHHIGPPGSGQLAKMVNQICIAGVVQGLAEGLRFGQLAGLDMPRVLEAIGQGAAQSWQMNNRGTSMLEGKFDFGFAVDWMRKDLGLALNQARTLGASLPVAALVDQFYADLQAAGAGRQDTSSLIKRLGGGSALK